MTLAFSFVAFHLEAESKVLESCVNSLANENTQKQILSIFIVLFSVSIPMRLFSEILPALFDYWPRLDSGC